MISAPCPSVMRLCVLLSGVVALGLAAPEQLALSRADHESRPTPASLASDLVPAKAPASVLPVSADVRAAGDAWRPLPTTGAPSARVCHTAVWTGSEMIVWGGTDRASDALNSGARYNPNANTWTALPATGVPSARAGHTAVWTGSEMIVWGGSYYDGSTYQPLGDGAAYAPPGVVPAPTPLPTRPPTATVPSGPATIGGRGAGLRLGPPFLSWTGGNVQFGYYVFRIGTGTTKLPPGGLPLPASATEYTDTQGPRDPFLCYLVVPLGSTGALVLSDLLCGLPGTRSGGGAPDAFTIRLNQGNTATLTWTAPGVVGGYNLIAIPIRPGAVPRQRALAADATSATDSTGGIPTCYVLQAQADRVTIGSTDVLCAIPGVSTFPGP